MLGHDDLQTSFLAVATREERRQTAILLTRRADTQRTEDSLSPSVRSNLGSRLVGRRKYFLSGSSRVFLLMRKQSAWQTSLFTRERHRSYLDTVSQRREKGNQDRERLH